MINHEELEDAALFGLEESLNHGYGLSDNESCFFDNDEDSDDQISEMAEALYSKYMGWA